MYVYMDPSTFLGSFLGYDLGDKYFLRVFGSIGIYIYVYMYICIYVNMYIYTFNNDNICMYIYTGL